MQSSRTNNIFLSEIKGVKKIKKYIKSSLINSKYINFEESKVKELNQVNADENIKEHNDFFFMKNGANMISPYHKANCIRKMKNNIEEIVIKTSRLKKNLSFSNTTPLSIYKQKNKSKLSKVKLNIKKLLLGYNQKNNSLEYIPYPNDDEYSNNFEPVKGKTFSNSFRNYSNYNLKKEKNNSISIDNNSRYNRKINKYTKKILNNSYIKSKTNIKIDTNYINNINNNSENGKKKNQIFMKKEINLIPINQKNIKNKLNNNNNNINTLLNNQMTNVTNVTFDTSVQNDLFNFTDGNNQNNENESKVMNNDIENEIKIKIQTNNEIKASILLLIEEINKIRERQEQIINIENDNKIKNNEKNIKISNIIKKTYNFLNDFNKVINQQNQQIYQEILNNLNIFFND